MTILDQILVTKREEVAARKHRGLDHCPAPAPPRGFKAALDTVPGFGLIAEIKKASPSKGLIRKGFDPAAHAAAYAAGGAACLSVLTDADYFQGHENDLIDARAACTLPVLRKDFMIDPWQARESRAIGADAILIIVAALSDGQMIEIEAAAIEQGMDVLVEVHDGNELARALRLKSRLIGVNNRDLKSFAVDLDRTVTLIEQIPPGYTIVAESGLRGHGDLAALADKGIRCFLVGETLMRADDVEAATRNLLTGS